MADAPLYLDLSDVDLNATETRQALAAFMAAGAGLLTSPPEVGPRREAVPAPTVLPLPAPVSAEADSVADDDGRAQPNVAEFLAAASPGAIWVAYQIADAKARDTDLNIGALRELHPDDPTDRFIGGWVKSALTAGLRAGFGTLFRSERVGFPRRTVYRMEATTATQLRRQLARHATDPPEVRPRRQTSSPEEEPRAASLVGKKRTTGKHDGSRTSVSI